MKPACHHTSQSEGNGYDSSEKNTKIGTCVISQRPHIRFDIADVPLNMLDGRFKLRHPRFHTIKCAPSAGRLQGRPWRLSARSGGCIRHVDFSLIRIWEEIAILIAGFSARHNQRLALSIGRLLWPPRRQILKILLSSVRRHVEQRAGVGERFGAEALTRHPRAAGMTPYGQQQDFEEPPAGWRGKTNLWIGPTAGCGAPKTRQLRWRSLPKF